MKSLLPWFFGNSAVEHTEFSTFWNFRIVLDCERLVFLLLCCHHVDRVDEGWGGGSRAESVRVDQVSHLDLVGALSLDLILLGVSEYHKGLTLTFLIL